MNVTLFNIAMVLYLVATVLYFVYAVSRNTGAGVAATLTAFAGWLVNTGAIGVRWAENYKAGYSYGWLPPLSNMYESMVFFAWSIMAIYLVFERLYGYKALGAFIAPLGFAGIAVVSFAPNISSEL